MDSRTIVWIVVAVVAILVIAALVFAARKRRNQRRHVEAERIREDITTHVTKVERRESLADETAARARAAEAEAEAKAAEAARLKDQADSHREAVAGSREEIEERRQHADRLDPKTRVDDDKDRNRAGQDAAAPQAAVRDPERR
jgi:FtsZ-interacting cell division protein ZipA